MIKMEKISSEEELREKVSKINGNVVLKFSSEICPPCIRLKEEIRKYKGDQIINILEVDVNESIDLPEIYEVSAVPKIILLDKECNAIKSRVGYLDLEQFVDFALK